MWCKIEGASSLLCDKKHRRKVLPRYINDLVNLYVEDGLFSRTSYAKKYFILHG